MELNDRIQNNHLNDTNSCTYTNKRGKSKIDEIIDNLKGSNKNAVLCDYEKLTPFISVWRADARLSILPDKSVDTIVSSPAYWQKRDYEVKKQIGQEKSPEKYIKTIVNIMENWKRCLKPSGSVFLNVGDSFNAGELLNIPCRIGIAAKKKGWTLRHQIIWEKPNSTPNSARKRLASRDEFILHFTLTNDFYWDIEGYKQEFGSITNIWRMPTSQHKGDHLAPYPETLVRRVLLLACPKWVCTVCGAPFTRQLKNTAELDETRPQAIRAMEIAKESKLSADHIAAIQAVGISDAGKAIRFQSGAGRNNERVIQLAREAKNVLGGYFREFTFAKKQTIGWKGCDCGAALAPGMAYDPFLGTGTTLRVAEQLGLSAVGSDLRIYDDIRETFQL